jgi:hypothetical protein
MRSEGGREEDAKEDERGRERFYSLRNGAITTEPDEYV